MLLRRARLTGLLLLAVLAGVAPASSAAEDRVLAQGAGAGSRWTVATVHSDGARVASRLEVSSATSPLAMSARLYVDGVRTATTNVVVRAAGGGQGVRVDGPQVAGLEVSVDRTEDDSAFRFTDVAITLTVNPDTAVHRGRLSLVVYAATQEIDLWRWTLSGAPGTTVLGTATGQEAFSYSARDFGGSDTSVYVGQTVPGAGGASARYNSGATRSVLLTPRFLGSFTTVGTDRLRVTGPGGYARDCTPACGFENEPSANRIRTSGTYAFALDGTSAGARGPGGLQVADTDIALHGAQPRPAVGTTF